jgi:hypothetical protein
MRFSRKPPVRKLSPARAPCPWDPPETELPGIVPINTLQFDRSGQAAVAITGISAYTSGFEIFVTRLIRPGAPGLDAETPDGMLAHESFQISLQLSDGRKVTSGRPHGDCEPTGPILRPRGGGALRTTSSRGGGRGRCRQAGRWSSAASGRCSGPAKRGWASTRN